jgi:hypothetical protein
MRDLKLFKWIYRRSCKCGRDVILGILELAVIILTRIHILVYPCASDEFYFVVRLQL